MWPEDYDAYETLETLPEPRCGNCKRCVNKSHCGHKNKKEASWCDKYRPEIKSKKRRKR